MLTADKETNMKAIFAVTLLWILWQADANEKYAHRGAAIHLFAIVIEKVSSWGSKTLGMLFST